MMKDENWRTIIFLIFFFLPLVSIQHFIFPLSWCVISDICNHTWRPECGYDYNLSEYKLFTDECDMFEYNCDNWRDYEPVNYKECFGAATMCPTLKCPKCEKDSEKKPDNFRRANSKDIIYRRMVQNQFATDLSALKKQMKGRRHTPEIMKLHKLLLKMAITKAITKAVKTTKLMPTEQKNNTKKGLNTIQSKAKTKNSLFTRILKKETVIVDGKLMIKIVKELQ